MMGVAVASFSMRRNSAGPLVDDAGDGARTGAISNTRSSGLILKIHDADQGSGVFSKMLAKAFLARGGSQNILTVQEKTFPIEAEYRVLRPGCQ